MQRNIVPSLSPLTSLLLALNVVSMFTTYFVGVLFLHRPDSYTR